MHRLIAAAAFALSLAGSASALGAPIDGGLDVQLWPGAEPGASLIVVSGSIAPDASLPATIALPVPTEGVVVWAGEVLGGDPAKDPAREPTLVDANGGRLAEFALEQSRQGQLEARGAPLTTKDGVVTATMRYVQSVPATTTVFSVRVPPGARDVAITPRPLGRPQTNDVGEALYALTPQRLGLGDELVVSVSYRLDTAADGTQGAASTLLPVLVVLLAVAVVALVVVIARQSAQASAAATSQSSHETQPYEVASPSEPVADDVVGETATDDAFIIDEDT